MAPADAQRPVEAPTGAPGGASPRRPARRPLLLLVRVAVSGGLLWLLLRRVSLPEVGPLLAAILANWPLLAAAAALPGLGLVVGALRWQTLLAAQGERHSLRTLSAALLVGTFFNQFLPSTIGGDVARALWIERAGRRGPSSRVLALAVVALDRLVGITGIAAAVILTAAVSPALVAPLPGVWALAAAVAVFGSLLAFLFFHPGVAAAARRMLSAPSLARLRERARTVHAALGAYRSRKRSLGAALLLSIGLQGLIVLQHITLAAAIPTPASAWELGLVVPVVTLIAVAPITVNGIGLRENALAVLAAPIGFRPEDALAMGLLVVAITALYGAAGGLIWLGGRSASSRSPR